MNERYWKSSVERGEEKMSQFRTYIKIKQIYLETHAFDKLSLSIYNFEIINIIVIYCQAG